MYDYFWNRIEDAVEDADALRGLQDEIEKADLTDEQRERLLGLTDRYLAGIELAGEGAETTMVDVDPPVKANARP